MSRGQAGYKSRGRKISEWLKSDGLIKVEAMDASVASASDLTGINNKLNTVAYWANNYSHPSTHPASMLTGPLPAIDGSALLNLPSSGAAGGSTYYSKNTSSPLTLPSDFDGNYSTNMAYEKAVLWGYDDMNMSGYNPPTWNMMPSSLSSYTWTGSSAPSGPELGINNMGIGVYVILAATWGGAWSGVTVFYPYSGFSSYVNSMTLGGVSMSNSTDFEMYGITIFGQSGVTVTGGEATVDETFDLPFGKVGFVWRLDKAGAFNVSMGMDALQFSTFGPHDTVHYYKYKM